MDGGSTACHELNLVLDLNQKVLKFLVFLSNSSLYLSVFVLELLLMYFLILFNCPISMNFPCLWKTRFRLLTYLHALRALGNFLDHFCGFLILCEKWFPTFRHTVFCRADIPIK